METIVPNNELKLFFELLKTEQLDSLGEAYIYLKNHASTIIKNILDNNSELKDRLIRLATPPRSVHYNDGVMVTTFSDEEERKIIGIAHCWFELNSGCANLHLTLDMGSYLKKNSDIITCVFVYSQDGEEITYAAELLDKDQLDMKIPFVTFFKHLPLLALFTNSVTALEQLEALSHREYSTIIRPQMLDFKSGEVIIEKTEDYNEIWD